MGNVHGIPPLTGPSSFGFNRGGKNHLGSELQKFIKEYRELMEGYPKDYRKLEIFLEKKLAPFLGDNKQAIIQQCEKKGWTPEGAYNFQVELDTAIKTIGNFLQNSQEGEAPLFMLNEAITQVHFFLVNSDANGS